MFNLFRKKKKIRVIKSRRLITLQKLEGMEDTFNIAMHFELEDFHSRVQTIMSNLSINQGGIGRHKCTACVYELGYYAGYKLDEQINLSNLLNSLEESQAKEQRHKSPHAVYAQGYVDDVKQYYSER